MNGQPEKLETCPCSPLQEHWCWLSTMNMAVNRLLDEIEVLRDPDGNLSGMTAGGSFVGSRKFHEAVLNLRQTMGIDNRDGCCMCASGGPCGVHSLGSECRPVADGQR